MAEKKAAPIDTQALDKDEEKQQKAVQRQISKQAKAVAKEQDELDERVVMRSSYGGPAGKGRFDSGFEYDRELKK